MSTHEPTAGGTSIEISDAQLAEFKAEHALAETELVFALVGALGTDIERISNLLHLRLEKLGYLGREIHLSALLREIAWQKPLKASKHLDTYVLEHMDAGKRLREDWKRSDALALLAIAKLRGERRRHERRGGPTRQAWILRQLKTPDEVQTLRDVYGSRFFLIAAYSPLDERTASLDRKIADSRHSTDQSKWRASTQTLLRRDQSEGDGHGQNVIDTFHRADLFVDASNSGDTEAQLERLLEVVLANPFRTPTNDEFALFEAAGAARLSAEPGRQVGAALANPQGEIIALGTNEVPRPGGGIYREGGGDPDVPDRREFRYGKGEQEQQTDTNDRMQREIATEISEALTAPGRNWLNGEVEAEKLLQVILDTRLGDLTEFGRAVHAEMSAILDAARNGHTVAGSTLYVTTFPCHTCVRHIVCAGIASCVFLAPYTKSQAETLHSDSIAVASGGPAGKKVPFNPFVGVAPRRYAELFTWQRRKNKDGTLSRWDGTTAKPRLNDSEPVELRQNRPAYRVREDLTIALLTRIQTNKTLRLKTSRPAKTASGPTQSPRRQDRKEQQ